MWKYSADIVEVEVVAFGGADGQKSFQAEHHRRIGVGSPVSAVAMTTLGDRATPCSGCRAKQHTGLATSARTSRHLVSRALVDEEADVRLQLCLLVVPLLVVGESSW